MPTPNLREKKTFEFDDEIIKDIRRTRKNKRTPSQIVSLLSSIEFGNDFEESVNKNNLMNYITLKHGIKSNSLATFTDDSKSTRDKRKKIKKKNIQQNNLLGSPEYFSPELLKDNENHSEKVDWWAFGICLYEVCRNKFRFALKLYG